jgi:hypothetical protein
MVDMPIEQKKFLGSPTICRRLEAFRPFLAKGLALSEKTAGDDTLDIKVIYIFRC